MTDTLEPYQVEKKFECPRCGSSNGVRYLVVYTPDDVVEGREFDDEEDAESYADALNRAYEIGRKVVQP